MRIADFPFYADARSQWLATQDRQIQKGLKKYPEAFNPFSWNAQQLVDHALEESVDLTHYLIGLKKLLDAKDVEIERLKGQITVLKMTSKAHSTTWTRTSKKPSYFDLDDE